ncbi:hypothetical protein AMS68_004456 [Peltaster fructicola]|uniref:DUF7907 domain-containing protein n=1 Tax=Peltaster fructicola TaxID=286661 RepID=A0A6H0XWE4_9PEZI|nr:hypothetical protein AMS68_004456 [Peltaster fructicola]
MLATAILSLLAISAGVIAQSSTIPAATPTPSIYANNSREFYIRTELKVKDPAKARFDDLWLYSYHTGAGLSDVTFAKNKTQYAAKGWINYTTPDNGQLTFALGSSFPWTMSAEFNSYRLWNPLHINVGLSQSFGYYINDTGLTWNTDYHSGLNTSHSSFGGWLVCDWWYANSPQLFWRERYLNSTDELCNCADVYLCPEYI